MAIRRRRRPATARPGEARTACIETSVLGMTPANQPRALRQPTQRFLRQCASGLFIPYISTVVTGEIASAPAAVAARIASEINKLAPRLLEPSAESEELADAYLSAGVIPAHLGLPPAFAVHDLLSGAHFDWRIGANYVRLEPGAAHVLRVEA